MKTMVWVLVVILILVGGYFILKGSSQEVGAPATEEESMQQVKIDPQVACESALAYMTFESGEEADAFVEACVAGEHPEVIQRYINDMGYNEATI